VADRMAARVVLAPTFDARVGDVLCQLRTLLEDAFERGPNLDRHGRILD
jgi:hypothetical protein